MRFFEYHDGELCAEQIPVAQLAEQFGTPCFVYSRASLEHQWHKLDNAFADYPHTIYYAVKANSNLAVLNLLARLGSGFDIVSSGELERVMAAGGDPQKVVYSGVAKSHHDIRYALECGIHCLNIESQAELERINQVAEEQNAIAPVALRINPDVDPDTHPYIATGLAEAKFGIPVSQALELFQQAGAMKHINACGIASHIGSQITSTQPFTDALQRVAALLKRLQQNQIEIQHLDLGGGLGINYNGEQPPEAEEYVHAMLSQLQQHNISLPVGIEPGRYIVGDAGIMLTRVEYLKENEQKRFAVVDAGMNDLLRPALYQAHHPIVNTRESKATTQAIDIVGPVCESADVLGYQRQLAMQAGDLLAVKAAGAYGFVMSSNYNSRPRAAEVMVDGDEARLIKPRETVADLMRGETLLD